MASRSCGNNDPTASPAIGAVKQRKRGRSQDESESVMPQNTVVNKRAKCSYSQSERQKKKRRARKFSGPRRGSGHSETRHPASISQQASCSLKSIESSRNLSQSLPPSSRNFERSRKRRNPYDLNAISDSVPSQRKRMKHECASTNEGRSRKVQHRKPRIRSPSRKHAQRSPNQAHSPSSRSQEEVKIFDKSWKGSMVPLLELRSMTEWPVEKLVKKLSYNIKAFQFTLADKGRLEKPGIMDTLLMILSKVCSATISNSDLCRGGLQILTEAMSDRCAAFQLQLKMYIKNDRPKHGRSSITHEKKIQRLCDLFSDILRALPASSKFWLPVEDLQSAINQLPNSCSKIDLLKKMDALSFHLNAERETESKKNHPGDAHYREMDIIPSWKEVCTPQKPQLTENIVVGGYCSWLHYYDTQFRLLREDFIGPLRKGICEYLEGGSGRKSSGNIRVYKKVLLQEPVLYTSYGVCYRIKIAHLSNKIDWVQSKRLCHGSLLCLTPEHDNFKENIFFATVVDRDLIAQGELITQFKKGEKMLHFSCTDTPFIMIESCDLFEPSQHVLRALQAAEVDTMPFTEYLVEANVSSVGEPRYFAMSHESEYNLSSLLTEEAKNVIQDNDGEVTRGAKRKKAIPRNRCFLVEGVTDFKQWPTCDQTGLDTSQLKGIHMALTQEIAVIQGPPGTGKTHIGLKIVEALLSNSTIHNRRGSRAPILVMCYTNHALDQFLEGILKSPVYKNMAPKLIRVGGRSISEELAEFNLVEVRKNVFIPKQVRRDKKIIERDVKKFKSPDTEAFLSATNSCVTFPLKVLEKVMHPDHHYQLFELQKTHRQSYCVLEMWLGLDTSNSHWNEIVDSAISKFEQEESLQAILYNSKGSSEVGRKTDKDYQSEFLAEEAEEMTTELSHGDEYRSDYAHRKEFTCNPESDFSVYRCCVSFDRERACTILRYGFSLAPMSEEDARSVPDIHNLSFEDRWRLYQFWHSLHLKHLREKCEMEFVNYEELCSKQAAVRRTADRYALETACIIGMTTTGAAKHQRILRRVKPKIVIVEEAAEVLESHIVSALDANTQHLILIGDHKQLRPKPNEYELTKKYQFDVSLFERLVRNGFPRATLECQHRMRPEIAELIKPHIYSELSNHSSVENYPVVRGVSTNLFFINHKFPEEEDENLTNHSNDHEAKYLVGLCQYILQQEQYSPENITILVTYAGQQRRVRKLISEGKLEGVRVDTVDNFQGEENNIILLSLVRSNSEKIVGFLKEENRICVALSRAQHGFYCIGDFDMLRQTVPLWERIVADVEGKGKLGEGLLLHCSNHPEKHFVAKSSEDFEKNSPDGGCLLDCNFRLECGHACTLKCHFTDPEHVGYECKKKCMKLCPQGHPCCKLCFVPCGECEVRVSKVMPHCQHEQEMSCWEDPSKVDCNSLCENKCLKGHRCPLPCHQKSQENCPPCVVKVPFIVPSCQHEQLVECHEDTAEILCRAKCSHECPQGHQCRKLCHEVCGECMEPVLKVLEVCNHVIHLPCHVEPIHSECTKPCKKVLQCGHKCQLKCGQDCSTCLCAEVVSTEVPGCGHKIQVPCHMLRDLSRKSDVARSTPIQCEVFVTQKWPCGHTFRRPCYQTAAPEDYPCKVSVTKELACGHPCTKQCWEAFDDECQSTCNQVLSCGHKCKGQCSQCTTEHMHKICPFKTEVKRFCGHSLEISCSGLVDEHPCDQGIPVTCCHGSRHISCSDGALHKCHEKCLWRCPHSKCSKRCYEMCNRPRCNKHCRKRLRCRHTCFGLCGEPCLTFCPLCEPKLFQEKLCVGKFSEHILYYELDCKHIFPVKYLDEYVHQLINSRSHLLVCPVQCPVKECSQPFNRSYRYGNDTKQILPYIQDVHNLVTVNPSNEDTELLDSRLDCLLSNIATSSIVSGCRSRMAHSVSLSIDEKFTIFILTEIINIFDVLCKESPSTGIVAYYKKTFNETESLLKKLFEMVYQPLVTIMAKDPGSLYPCLKLTHQFASDLRREFFRLYLQVYTLLVKSGRKSALSGVDSHHRVSLLEGAPLAPPSLVDTRSSSDSSSFGFPTQPESTSSTESDPLGGNLSEDEKSPSQDTVDTCSSVDSDSPMQALYPESTRDTESEELSQSDSEDESSSGQLDNSASPSVCEDQSVSSDEDSPVTLGNECLMSVELPDPKLQVELAVIAAEEYFMKDVPVTVTKSDITAHCEAMGKPAVLDYKRMLDGMDHFFPVVQSKGQWWRCPSSEEYYCLPSSSDRDKETKCPKCSGKELDIYLSTDSELEIRIGFWSDVLS